MLSVIQSKDNPKIKNAMKLAKSATYRQECGLFFAATPKVVMDILQAGFEAESLFLLQDQYDAYAHLLEKENVYIITDAVCDKLSEDKSAQGVFAIFKMKKTDINQLFSAKRLLILEDIQDPGNLGAIMRTAIAFGYQDVVISKQCADIYSPKVLRSSMTASVKLNVYRVKDIPLFVQDLNGAGFSTVATCLENAKELGTEKIALPVAVLIGNEGRGLQQSTLEQARYRTKIPMTDQIESLNAAVSAGIMMWTLRGE